MQFKNFFLFMLVILLVSTVAADETESISEQAAVYQYSEMTSSAGFLAGSFTTTPLLSLTRDRKDILYLPSTISVLGKGEVYLDNQSFNNAWPDNVGAIIPTAGRKLFFNLYLFRHNNVFNDPQNLMSELDPAEFAGISDLSSDNFIAPLILFGGGGFSYNFGGFHLGMGMKYYTNALKNKTTNETAGTKVDTGSDHLSQKLEFTPSFTVMRERFSVDFGFNFAYQWINNTIHTENRGFRYDYTGNPEFSLYGRGDYQITDWSAFTASLAFGYIPFDSAVIDVSNSDKIGKREYDDMLFDLRLGVRITPIEDLVSTTGIAYLAKYSKRFAKDVVTDDLYYSEKNIEKFHTFYITQMVEYQMTDWFSMKAGVGKTFRISKYEDTEKEDQSESRTDKNVSQTLDTGDGFGKYVGLGFHYRNFRLDTVVNLGIITKGPYMITGNNLNEMAYLANLSYDW